ncbi:TlpA family protein disulfide reductase [Shewanella marina]|uniref:TlpA family protein disulfide reductase n=1 Tax=Shewanella marina TaxID=487319 RepID=UPI00046FD841|nr:thioredoxin family protein [Shewanella marina]
MTALRVVKAAWFAMLMLLVSTAQAATFDSQHLWSTDNQAAPQVKLYFFWSETCPHCAKAHPFIDDLAVKYPWVSLYSEKVTEDGAFDRLQVLANATNQAVTSVPFVAVCGQAIIGYSSAEVTGKYIEDSLLQCYQQLGGKLDSHQQQRADSSSNLDKPLALFSTCSGEDGDAPCGSSEPANITPVKTVQPIEVPLIGAVAPEKMSLPLLTVVLAGVDAFNPCAFFVLLFLLSIMVNAKSRGRMLLVGGIFVFFSGFIYFIFMSAWLNIFQLLGAGSSGGTIILVAGLLALVAGTLNLKDFFFSKGKVTLSMSTENRTSLIKRMGKLSSASNLPTMIVGTTILAILANTYELLCTAGFPMIYTSVLSMHELPVFERYMYLVMYNIVYVIPLATIVIIFSMTLGKRKLSEKEGESLKLMSGLMMFGLGGMLVWDPTSMQNPVLAIGLILMSIIITIITVQIRKRLSKKK